MPLLPLPPARNVFAMCHSWICFLIIANQSILGGEAHKIKSPSAGLSCNPTKSVKKILTTDFADIADKHTVIHPYDPYYTSRGHE
jgi:hypothetical protein